MTVTMESAIFMGKNQQNNCHSIVNTTDLTLKQMFDTSTRWVSEQNEISGLETIGWENSSWKYLSLIGDEHMDIKILGNLLRETIDRGNLRNRHHQVIQKRIMVNLGLLKSGKVELRSTIDQGNLRKLLGILCNKLPLIVKNHFSTEMHIP